MSQQDAPTASTRTLPRLRLTRVSDCPGPGYLPVDHWHNGKHVKYWRAPWGPRETRWTSFTKIPLVLDSNGSPWPPACLWLIERARAKPLSVASLKPIAQDLAAYKAYLDEMALDWDDFSSVDKYPRPTYIYRTRLSELVNARALMPSTASRRMSTVIAFYRFLMKDPRAHFDPANSPWIDKGVNIAYTDEKGFKQVKEVNTTDISIKVPKREDAWDGVISDGGKLRPLPIKEQRALIAALKKLGNVEYSLMHWIALLCGAREMTALTLRVRDFERTAEAIRQWPHKLRCGPGTGIDTKRDVQGVYLTIHRALYELLHAYAVSERARKRRSKSTLGETSNNYLFLTNQGQPYYESKQDRSAEHNANSPQRRTALDGRRLREFIKSAVIPEVRTTIPGFNYRFHDLRATFGMNWVDDFMRGDGDKPNSRYVWARDQLRRLMWHKNPQTTDRYLEHREHMHNVERAQEGWSGHIVDLIRMH